MKWAGIMLVLALLGGVAHADAKAGKKLYAGAMKLYRAKKLGAAKDELMKAVAEDPTAVQAHWDLARVASLLGDAETASAQLGWLTEAAQGGNRVAEKLLDKGAKEPDLAFMLSDPGAREMLKLHDADEYGDEG